MYEGVVTWNPLAGRCLHECDYCSTKSLQKRYPLLKEKYSGPYRVNMKELDKSLGKGKTVFVCAQNDLFEKDVPAEFIRWILARTRIFDENVYMFQSKNPNRFLAALSLFPENSWLGTTIETDIYDPTMSKAPSPVERSRALHFISKFKKYITIEPIMNFHTRDLAALVAYAEPDKVYIGADSKGNKLPEPSEEQIINLVGILKHLEIPVELKSNLRRLAPSLFTDKEKEKNAEENKNRNKV